MRYITTLRYIRSQRPSVGEIPREVFDYLWARGFLQVVPLKYSAHLPSNYVMLTEKAKWGIEEHEATLARKRLGKTGFEKFIKNFPKKVPQRRVNQG